MEGSMAIIKAVFWFKSSLCGERTCRKDQYLSWNYISAAAKPFIYIMQFSPINFIPHFKTQICFYAKQNTICYSFFHTSSHTNSCNYTKASDLFT